MNKINYELIALYEQRLLTIWLFEFVPILIILIIGYQIGTEVVKYKIEINPLWLFYLLLTILCLGVICSAMGLGIRFLNNLFLTKKKLKLALKRGKE